MGITETCYSLGAPNTVRRNPEFTARLWVAYQEWEKRHRDETQTDIARRVSKALGRSVSQVRVSRWINGQVPSLREIEALATVLGTDPCVLAFGEPGEGKGGGSVRTLPRRRPTRPGEEKRA